MNLGHFWYTNFWVPDLLVPSSLRKHLCVHALTICSRKRHIDCRRTEDCATDIMNMGCGKRNSPLCSARDLAAESKEHLPQASSISSIVLVSANCPPPPHQSSPTPLRGPPVAGRGA